MSYSNYLIKVGSSEIPMKYITRGTYKAVMSKQIAHQYTDANGDEHYEMLAHRKLIVELGISDCSNTEHDTIMALIRNAFVNNQEEKVLVTAYVPALDRYVSQYCRLEDESPVIFDAKSGKLIYQGISLKFTGYGGTV